MTLDVAVEPLDDSLLLNAELGDQHPKRPRRRLRKILIRGGVLLVVLTAAGALWFVLGRDQAHQLTADDALADFRAASGSAADAAGRPVAGVYSATASGSESIGLPGFDETLGPNAPVTVTYADEGCYSYRADFNSHHWRAWTFCPTENATFSLTKLTSWTARKAPGLNIATLTTYTCERPLDFLWNDAAVGDTRSGTCTGTSDMDDSVTSDAGSIEVLDRASLTIDGTTVDVIHARTTDKFGQAQTGSEVDEWWLDATTGLPVKVEVNASLKGGASNYAETPHLALTSLTPAT